MKQLGDWLKQARIEKGLSLEDIESMTKIRVRYLQALEEGEIDKLPGRAYTIGFLRTYAQLLDLHADNVVAYFKEHVPDQDQVTIPVNQTVVYRYRKRQQRKQTLLVGFLLIVLVMAGVYFWNRYTQSSHQPQAGNPAQVTPYTGPSINEVLTNIVEQSLATIKEQQSGTTPPATGTPTTETPTTETPTQQTKVVTVVVDAYQGDCWISVKMDGQTKNYKLLKGESRTFTSDQAITIKFGNAGGVSVNYNGQLEKPLGTNGQVLTRTFGG